MLKRSIAAVLALVIIVYCFGQGPGPVLRNGLSIQVNGVLQGTQPVINYAPAVGLSFPCTNGSGVINCAPGPNTAYIPSHDQIRANEDFCNSTTGNQTYTCKMPYRAMQSYSAGMRVLLQVDTPCTSNCTLTIDSNAQVNLYKADCVTPAAGDIVPSQPQWIWYNGSVACMLSDAAAVSNFSTNITPVTVSAAVSTDQNLMTLALPAGKLNILNRTLRIAVAGTYTTTIANTSTITIKAKLCSVSGCGSGTALVIASWVSGTNAGAQTNDPFSFILMSTTQTVGASSAYEAHGNMTIDLTGVGVGASVYPDSNSALIGTIDATQVNYLQVTGAFSSASASNSITQRQMTVEVLN